MSLKIMIYLQRRPVPVPPDLGSGVAGKIAFFFRFDEQEKGNQMIPSISSTPTPYKQQITGAYQGPPETPYIIFLVQYV